MDKIYLSGGVNKGFRLLGRGQVAKMSDYVIALLDHNNNLYYFYESLEKKIFISRASNFNICDDIIYYILDRKIYSFDTESLITCCIDVGDNFIPTEGMFYYGVCIGSEFNIFGSIEKKIVIKNIEISSFVSCQSHYIIYVSKNKLYSFHRGESLFICSAQKVAGFDGRVYFLDNGNVYEFKIHTNEIRFEIKADDVEVFEENLVLTINGKLCITGKNTNNQMSEKYLGYESKIYKPGFSIRREPWSIEKHCQFSRDFKKRIFTFTLVNRRKGKILPKWVLFEIYKFL